MSEQKYLKVELIGGLCNKLFCFFSAVDIALTEGYTLIEPEFGWKTKVKMSSVWNIDKIRTGIPELKWCSSDVFQLANIGLAVDNIVCKTGAELWAYSESVLLKQRKVCIFKRVDDVMCRVLALLEPAECVFAAYRNENGNGEISAADWLGGKIAVHFRTESDWQAYSVKKQRRMPMNEHCWSNNTDICNMVVAEFGKSNDYTVYIVSGEHGDEIMNILRDIGINSEYNYNIDLEYEQNAAMHWWICCNAGRGFVGLSRSTFSNLVCLRRELDRVVGGCWIYNYWSNGNKKLQRRVDAGLQPVAYDSITKVTNIIW
jgi:hypothetical protein